MLSEMKFSSILVLLLGASEAGRVVKMLRNTFDPWDFESRGGAILRNASYVSQKNIEEFTICLRVVPKVLGGIDQLYRGWILQLADW